MQNFLLAVKSMKETDVYNIITVTSFKANSREE